MWWELRAKFKAEWTYVYLQLIHGDVWQKPTQHCKEVTLQLKIIYGEKLYTHTDTESMILTYIQMTSICRHSINLSTK